MRREYRSTYRDTMTSSERLVAGKWWGTDGQTEGRTDGQTDRPAAGPTLISVEADLARELGVTVGDEIVWDVQGIPVVSRVANLREVEWARFQTNFIVVFQSGVLEAAPQMHVTLARVDSAAARGRVQRRVAERYPNVAAIDLSQIQQAIEAILSKAALAVRFLAFFSLAAGAVVLVGAVTSARLQRLREGVLLKTLGATRGQVLRILLVEYAALGLLAGFAAIALSSTAGWALAKWFFKARFDLPALNLTGLALALVTLTIAVGLWNSAEVLKRPPLESLRAE